MGGFLGSVFLVLILIATSMDPAWAETVRIGVLAYRGKAEAAERWQGHAQYLGERLAPLAFEVVPLGYGEIDQAVARRTVSFVVTNSGHYTELEMTGAVSAIATRLMAGPGGVLDRFGGVFFTRADRTDITGYPSLAGKRILISDRSSLGGWQAPLREAVEAGLAPDDLQPVETGNQQTVVAGVLAGQADAGFARSDQLESMAAAGTLDLAALRVVAARQDPGFPYLHSTRLYPEWPFARVEGTPDQLVRKVAIALLSMPPDDAAARSAGLAGWNAPRNYESVQELFQVARLGPYGRAPISLRDVASRYGVEIAAILTALFLALLAAVAVVRRSNGALRDEAARRKATESQLSEREARFRSLFEENVLGIVYQERSGRLVAANKAAAGILGLSQEAMLRDDAEFAGWHAVHPDGSPMKPEEHPGMLAMASGQSVSGMRVGFHNPALDQTRWLNASAVPQFRAGERHPCQAFLMFEDITEKVAAETRLNMLATVFANTREGILIVDRERRIIEVNDAVTRISGHQRAALIGQTPRILHGPEQADALFHEIEAALEHSGHWQGEMIARRADGSPFPVQVSASRVRNGGGEVTHTVGVFSDITALKESQAKLEYQAYFDALTGLPNRVLLIDRMRHAMAKAERAKDIMAVCYLDLDGFKPVNDMWGHAVGDSLLTSVAERLRKVVRGSDTVSRLGGDEFVLILSELGDHREVIATLERLCKALAAPYPLGEFEATVSASIGVTLYPADPAEPGILLRHADHAMYQAKKGGRNRYHVYDAEYEKVDESRSEARQSIQDAIDGGQLRLHYQPKVDIRSGRVVGAEALIRWQHPERGLLEPEEFLPVVEYVGLIIEVGRWVLDTAFADAQAWQSGGLELLVSANIAAEYLQHPDFVDELGALLKRYPGMRPEQFEMEVVETAALRNLAEVSARLRACQALGLRFALDDFGTGYSSLSYLKALPVDTLKIDRDFVRDMLDDAEDLAIVEGVIAMAAAFRRSVVAEGVESIAHGRLLLTLGCDYAQGFGIAHPMPADAIAGWIAAWQTPAEWLETASTRWTRDDVPLYTLEIDHKHWMRDLIAHLESANDDAPPPIADPQRCRFGQWLDTDGSRRFGNTATYTTLTRTHREVHRLASELVAGKQAGHPPEESQSAALQAASQQLLDQLNALRTAVTRMRETLNEGRDDVTA